MTRATHPLQNSFRSGLTMGLIMAFLMLIGFFPVAALVIGKIIGFSPDPGKLTDIKYLVFLMVILGVWSGYSITQANKSSKWSLSLLAALVYVVTCGLILSVLVSGLAALYENHIDLRTYLNALSPEVVKFVAFGMPWLPGGLSYLGLLFLTGLVGSGVCLLGAGRLAASIWGAIERTTDRIRNLPAVRRVMGKNYFKFGLFAVLLVILYILPQSWGSYWNYIMGTVGIYVILGLGLNIIVGLSGQLVLGYVAFFAIGAYTVALLNAPEPHHLMWGFWIAMVLGIVLAALSGILIGLPIMRLRGDYLAIVTLGFGEIIRILLKSDLLASFTGGPRGIQNIKGPEFFGIQFNSDVDFMYIIFIAVIFGVIFMNRIQNSRVGRSWLSIREDETVARATGVNSTRYKLMSLALGAAFAGLGGVIFAARNQYTGPGDHDLMVSINVLAIVIIGGMGSIPGVFLGAFVLKGLPELLREIQNFRLLAFGALLVAMMVLRPQGLWPVGRPKMTGPSQKSDLEPPNEEVKNG